MGLFGATVLGVGAIVGGGILALAGTAFSVAGPSAMVSFALNGGIALLTAASFARLARRFPESGGTYTYARNVFSIELAFVVGWVVWFASIVAGVLYALGFAAFFMEGLLRALPQLAETRMGGDTARLAAGRDRHRRLHARAGPPRGGGRHRGDHRQGGGVRRGHRRGGVGVGHRVAG